MKSVEERHNSAMAPAAITKIVDKYNIDLVIVSLKKLTCKYPKDDALKQSLSQYEIIKLNI